MKLNTKCRYGTRAVLEIAQNDSNFPLKRSEIVRAQKISDSYLENILICLKKSGIIDTIRGPKGGYILKKSPSDITILDIVESLGYEINPVQCVSEKPECDRVNTCKTRIVWSKLKQVQKDLLSSINIQNLLEDDWGLE